MRSFVTASMIANRLCSPSRDGQELLPHLVEKLVTASIPREAIRAQRFPHGDEIYLHGGDGVLAVDDSVNHSLVPSGLSLWEMGTSTDPKSKADDDFSKAEGKLANAFPGVTPAVTPDQATFVFVTSKPWESGEWVKEKRAAGSAWKAIKVVDAVALEKWIEQCPAVMLWFAEVCGLPAEGLYDAEQYLRSLGVGFGVSSIAPDLVIAGRNEDLDRVRDLILQSTVDVHVRGESVEEAAAFLAAASLKNADAFAKNSPLVFADSRANLSLLATFGTEITLVPVDSEALARAKMIPGLKWRLVIPEVEASTTGSGGNSQTLSRCKRAAVEQHLVEKMNLTEHRARQIARDTKGSLIALLWLVGSGPVGVPRWACRKDATTHASLMLAGSWLGANENDTKIIDRLSRKEYRDIETLLQSAEVPEGPWIHRGGEWLCASRDFVWAQLVGKVTETMLGDFLAIVGEVVGETNPSLQLPPADRHMASILGKVRKYSGSLRAGLVDSVARLAIFRADGQAWADRIVHGLLDPEHPEAVDRWLSLTDVYSELAEAAPDVFLKSLDDMVRSSTGRQFFQDANSDLMFGPTSAHTYLLWALERLAWQNEYLSRVLSTLASLAQIDPGGKTMNRPKNSLVTILLPWSPQHAETMQNAARMLKMLCSTFPAVTWDLGLALLPTSHGVTSPTPSPMYRKHPGKREVTNKEYWEFVRTVVEMLIEWAGHTASRWASLVEAYPHVRQGYPEAGHLITNALAQVDISGVTEEEKAVVHAALRQLITRHREFPDADWSLEESDITPLEDLLSKFAPRDLVLLYGNLFSWNPDVPDAPMKQYESGWDEWLAEKHAQAAKAIYDQGGLRDIYRLAERVVIPESVGQALAKFPLLEGDLVDLLQKGLWIAPGDSAKSPLARLAKSYVWSKYREGGEKWLDDVLVLSGLTWTDESHANIALAIPSSPALWKRVEQWGAGAERLYWKNVEIRGNFEEHWAHVLAKWKEVSRPWSSLELVAHLVDERHRKSPIQKPGANEIMDILEQALQGGKDTEPLRQQGTMLTYYVEQVFGFLDTQDVDLIRMARLEWGWLRVLEHTKRGPRTLQNQVTSSPELFVELLKAVFRAEDEPRDKTVSEEQRKKGEQAYHVLNGIHSVPGYQPTEGGGTVDQSRLREWITSARRLAEEAKQLRVCDSQIGQILSYAPSSPDGSWPCIEVRNLIEEIQSQRLESGLRIGRYNQRGVFCRDTGGKQEWELAKKYRAYADQVRAQWPRTAALLDGLAKGYEGEAKQWDEEATREEFE